MEEAVQIVKQKYNIDISLKPEQKRILKNLIEKKDVFGVLPTGFGKSLTYIMLPLILDEVRLYTFVGKKIDIYTCNYYSLY